MNEPVKRILFWLPRGLTLLFAAFISLFALDVFGQGYGVWETITALFVHLVPTVLILAALAVAWRRSWAGAVLFVTLGVVYVVMAWGQFEWSAYLIVSGPAFLVGVLFLVDWLLGVDPGLDIVEHIE